MRETQRKGDTAVAQAIATFTRLGYDVAVPLTESASYDLVIDTPEEGLKRVQVRYTSTQEVDLRRIHSNSKGYVIKRPKKNSYDWLYVLKITGEEYIIEASFDNQRSIKPTKTHLIESRRGGVPEWLNGPVLKTGEGAILS